MAAEQRDFEQFAQVEEQVARLPLEEQQIFGETFVSFVNHGGLSANDAERLALRTAMCGNPEVNGFVKSERL